MLKHIIGKTLKIGFNVSAIAGIAASGTIAATKLNVVPEGVKQSVANIVEDYENPISEMMRDPESCYLDWNRDLKQYADDEEYKKLCQTKKQYDESSEIREKLTRKQEEVRLSTGEWPSGYEYCDEYYVTVGPTGGAALYYTYTYDDGLKILKNSNELKSCEDKGISDWIYRMSGERLPYYDYVNKAVIYGEEQ